MEVYVDDKLVKSQVFGNHPDNLPKMFFFETTKPRWSICAPLLLEYFLVFVNAKNGSTPKIQL